MSIHVITDVETREWRKYPATRYISVPMRGVLEDQMPADKLAALNVWREKFYTWAQSPEAMKQCLLIQELEKQLLEAKKDLQDLNEKATRKPRAAFLAMIRRKET